MYLSIWKFAGMNILSGSKVLHSADDMAPKKQKTEKKKSPRSNYEVTIVVKSWN